MESVFLGMESVQVGGNDEISRPDHAGWEDDEPPGETSKGEAGELRGQQEEDVERETERVFVPFLERNYGVHGVCGSETNIGHHDDDSVFLDVERAGVQGERPAGQPTRQVERANGQEPSEELANGVRGDLDEQRGDVG